MKGKRPRRGEALRSASAFAKSGIDTLASRYCMYKWSGGIEAWLFLVENFFLLFLYTCVRFIVSWYNFSFVFSLVEINNIRK